MAITLNSPVERLWPWLTRIGAARKAGSVPVGWYQVHAGHAETILAEQICRRLTGTRDTPLRCRHGMIQAGLPHACANARVWKDVVDADALFRLADRRARGIE